MRQWIHYGLNRLEFVLPDSVSHFVIEPRMLSAAADPVMEIEFAIDHPAGPNLESVVRPGKSVCIICDDISRPTPAEAILSVLLPRLERLGIPASSIRIVLALGSHRQMTDSEVDKKLGSGIRSRYSVLQSSFHDPESLINLGETDSGVAVEVFRGVMECDVRIGIGNIVPHGTLGWSGGAKILFPGVTSEYTVSQFHLKAALLGNSNFGVAENPIRLDIENWARMIGLHFIINTVLLGDGRLYRAVAGDPVAAHRAGVRLGRDVYVVKAPCRADIVVVDSHPSDGDFWQGTKGYYPSDILLKDHGTAILAAPCIEGVGPHSVYPAMIGKKDPDHDLQQYLEGSHPHMDPLAVAVGAQLARMRKRFDMALYSEQIDDEALHASRIRRVTSISLELARLVQRLDRTAMVAIIRCGAEVVPEIDST